MVTYNTQNPIGSADPRDLYDNAQNLDELTNSQSKLSHPDRRGVSRKTWHGMEEEFDAFIASSGYEFVGDYAAGIELTGYQQILRDTSGEFWRLSGSVTLPYTTTGAGLPEGGNFVAAGDAVLRQELALPVSGGNGALHVSGAVIYVDTIADLQALPTGELVSGQQVSVSGGLFKWNGSSFDPVGYIPILAWGAVGDGSADDTQPIRDAIDSGYPIDWQEKEYRVTGEIGADATITHKIDWISNGAVIKLDSSVSHQAGVITYRIKPHDHTIRGKFIVDASMKANIAFGLRNSDPVIYPDSFATFFSDGLEARNARRIGTFRAGNGLRIEGSFTSIVCDSLVIDGVELATGAGVPGSIGVTGAAFSRDGVSGGYPLYVSLPNPTIKKVYSEDPAYDVDMDGVQFFGNFSDSSALWSNFRVEGGTFENCWGRSIKSQMATGTIDGAHFKRTEGPTGGGTNPEIDFQGGQGFVRNISYDYRDSGPGSIVAQRVSNINKMPGEVNGVSGRATGAAVVPSILITHSPPGLTEVVLRNVNVDGNITRFLNLLCPNDGVTGIVENCRAPLLDDAVRAASGGVVPEAASYCHIRMENVQNSSPGSVIAVRQRVAGTSIVAYLTSRNLINLTGGDSAAGLPAETVGPPPNITRLKAASFSGDPQANSLVSLSGHSKSLANNEEWLIPLETVSIYSVILRFDHTTTAIVSAASVSGGRIETLFSGSRVSIGSLSEPTTGSLRIWVDGTDGNLHIRNVSGSTRLAAVKRLGWKVGGLD